MNMLDKLETMFADRQTHAGGDDERMAFDALPSLLKVARAVKDTDTRCLFRYRPDPCESCVMCVLRAALEPLTRPLAVEEETNR